MASLLGCKSPAIKSLIHEAEQGNPASQFELGWLYATGSGVRKDSGVAANWYRKAAEQGHAVAQNNLGSMYENGWSYRDEFLDYVFAYYTNQKKDYAEAMKWYRFAADQGNAIAQYNLGRMYENGLGVPADHIEARKWYRMAAGQGDLVAQYRLAESYATRRGALRDEEEALKWYRMAAAQGDANAAKMVPKYDKFDGNLNKAMQGDAEAQYNLGRMYDNGDGVVAQNSDKAKEWYLKAADQGYGQAQYSLGFYYNYGRHEPVNIMEALKWYRLAADGGHEAAKHQYHLLSYFVETRKKAESGNAQAQYALGRIYEQGAGVIGSAQEAKRWYGLAAIQGNAEASAALDTMRYEETLVKLREENEQLVRRLRDENERQVRDLRDENERLARELREEAERRAREHREKKS